MMDDVDEGVVRRSGDSRWGGRLACGDKLRLQRAMFVFVRQLLYLNALRKGVKVVFSRRAE